MRKTQYYQVGIELDDKGQFDHVICRDGIVDGIQRAKNDGGLVKLDDDTTEILGFLVERVVSPETPTEKFKELVKLQIEFWNAIRVFEKEVGDDLDGLQDRIEAIASGIDDVQRLDEANIAEVFAEYGIVEPEAKKDSPRVRSC